MLKDLAAKYYQQGYNCAETIIRAGNKYYNLGLDENAFRITGAFGGGLQVGDVCGALTGLRLRCFRQIHRNESA